MRILLLIVALMMTMAVTAQSEVVVLKIWEGMTFAQIGVVIGKSPNTVASRYRYAMCRLKQHLQRFPKEAVRDGR